MADFRTNEVPPSPFIREEGEHPRNTVGSGKCRDPGRLRSLGQDQAEGCCGGRWSGTLGGASTGARPPPQKSCPGRPSSSKATWHDGLGRYCLLEMQGGLFVASVETLWFWNFLWVRPGRALWRPVFAFGLDSRPLGVALVGLLRVHGGLHPVHSCEHSEGLSSSQKQL